MLLARRRLVSSDNVERRTCPSADDVPDAPHQPVRIAEPAASREESSTLASQGGRPLLPRFLIEALSGGKGSPLDPSGRGTLGLSWQEPCRQGRHWPATLR